MKIAKFTQRDNNFLHPDERPFPDYDPFGIRKMVDDYSMATRVLYKYSRPEPRPFILITARSCPYSCSFCVHDHGAKYRAHSIPRIIDEIKFFQDKYGFNILIIQDELFAVNKQRMREFCSALIEAKRKYKWDFDWMFQTHANSRLDYDTLKLAKESGCYLFSYGLESASPTILKSMNKKTQPPQIVEAIGIANSVGLGFAGNLIFGDPAETEETIQETLDFYFKYCLDELIFLSIVQPYPGSKIFEDAVKRGLIKDKAQYYENINEGIPNITSMNNQVWSEWVKWLGAMEGSLMFTRSTPALTYEKDKMCKAFGKMLYDVKVKCPFCGSELYFKDMLENVTKFVPACYKCGKRIRVNLPSPC